MEENVNATGFRLFDLPLELFLEIMLWAQHIWRDDAFAVHDPYTGVKRQFVNPQGVAVREDTCCHGSQRSTVPCCLSASSLAVTPSPAHAMSQLGKGVRSVLLGGTSRIWRLDNTFYKALADRSGRERPADVPNTARPVVSYRAKTFVAVNVCSCLIHGITPFYRSLQMVKLALPWGAPHDPTASIETMLLALHDEHNSPLLHFDLQLYPSPFERERPLIIGTLCNTILTSRCTNTVFFFYSPQLTSLYIEIPINRRPRLGASFFSALSACAASLEYLTIDAGDGTFLSTGNAVVLPKLRFIHLAIPDVEGPRLLGRLRLPDAADVHIQSVVDWRRTYANARSNVHEVNSDNSARDMVRLWKYAAALACPGQIDRVFGDSGRVYMSGQSLWHLLNTAALDIRLDPSTKAWERACSRFPEYVSLSLTSSVAEMKDFLESPGRGWRQSPPPDSKRTVRRSLSIRDGTLSAAGREGLFNPRLVKPVYDVIRSLISAVISPRYGVPYAGLSDVRHLVIHQDSFMPVYRLGWEHILDRFTEVRSIVILCPGLEEDEIFTENIEGRLAPRHWEALAMYLNDGVTAMSCPCLRLESLQLPRYIPPRENAEAFESRIEKAFNSRSRLDITGCRITCTLRLTSL